MVVSWYNKKTVVIRKRKYLTQSDADTILLLVCKNHMEKYLLISSLQNYMVYV